MKEYTDQLDVLIATGQIEEREITNVTEDEQYEND